MLLIISIIGSSLFLYYYKNKITWNLIKFYTYFEKFLKKNNNNNINIDCDIKINNILYIEHNNNDITDKLIDKINNNNLNIIENSIEIDNKKINLYDIYIIDNNCMKINLNNYLKN
tara:strand:- start:973 stop:1320 length:348 start_codon:yes stop_codon:yes gene_type:complete